MRSLTMEYRVVRYTGGYERGFHVCIDSGKLESVERPESDESD